jgi:ribose 5-phosphate isomerase B
MKIYLGADHGGFELKKALMPYLQSLGHEPVDCGNTEFDQDDNYPDFVLKAAEAVAGDPRSCGIVIGGSGQGEAMAANRVPGVRAAVFYGSAKPVKPVDFTGRESDDPYEIVRLTRLHNNSNVLSFGARFVGLEEAQKVVKLWLETDFSEDPRYAHRLKRVEDYSRG